MDELPDDSPTGGGPTGGGPTDGGPTGGSPGDTGPAPSGAVPEPATWSLMILGFGAVGYALRRRRELAAAL